jgi:hypothetical protein
MQHTTLADLRMYAIQLGRLLGDPLLGFWLNEETVAAFVADEAAGLDPLSARVVEVEAAYCRMHHQAALTRTNETSL